MSDSQASRDHEVQLLLDKQAITEVIYRYCRGLDRMDRELTLSCWHEGGTDDHGELYSGTASGFVDWVWPVHEKMERTQHTIQNVLIEVLGDAAVAESYFIVYLRFQAEEALFDLVGAGRYVDHFERKDGTWRIQHRTAVYDWERLEKTTSSPREDPIIRPHNPGHASQRGLRDERDYSYSALKELYAGRW